MTAQPRVIQRWARCEPGDRCTAHKHIDSQPEQASFLLTPEEHRFRSDEFRALQATALARCTEALRASSKPYVAFSGGKDSLVVAGLVSQALRMLGRPDDILLVWSDDELEYPETVEYMSEMRRVLKGHLQITLGYTTHAGWFTPWTDEPYFREPFEGAVRIDETVDTWMQRDGHDLVFLGTRAEESRRRRDWLVQAHRLGNGYSYAVRRGITRCTPIWDWTTLDVWAFIRGHRLRYNKAYDTYRLLGRPGRVGPLPLARREELEEGWPDLLLQLEARYGQRWK